MNLNPGSGNLFTLELVDGSSSLQAGESYAVTLATVATAGNIQLNGTPQSANTVIDGSNYTLTSSAFAFTVIALKVDGAGTGLVLLFVAVPVPEPASLLGVAVVALFGGYMRRQRSRVVR